MWKGYECIVFQGYVFLAQFYCACHSWLGIAQNDSLFAMSGARVLELLCYKFLTETKQVCILEVYKE